MPRLDDIIQLNEKEEVRAIARRHGVTVIPPLALALVLMVTPFFFLFPLIATGPTGIVLFFAVVSAGVIVAVRTFVMWDGDMLVVTTRRLVQSEQRGMFARTVNEVAYENLQDVAWSKSGPLDHLANTGGIRVRSLSGSQVIQVRFIPRPKDVQQLINDLRYEATQRTQRGHADASKDPLPVPLVVSRSPVSDAVASDDEEEDEEEEEEDEKEAPNAAPEPEQGSTVQALAKELAHADPKTLERISHLLHAEPNVIRVKRAFGSGHDHVKELKDLEE